LLLRKVKESKDGNERIVPQERGCDHEVIDAKDMKTGYE